MVATNLQEHTWTFRHYSDLIRTKNIHRLTDADKQKVIDTISKKNQIMSVKERTFIAYELPDLEEYTLSDRNENLSWYQPHGTPILKSWKYEGLFELQLPLTDKEQYFLKQYAS